MSFEINPVKAAARAYREGNCGIHALNDACFGTCAAYAGVSSSWDVPPDCANQCEKFVEMLRKEYYGLGYCDHHKPNRPVIWDQTPNFFPRVFERCGNVSEALAESLKMCEQTPYPEQCKEKAKLQSYAVVEVPKREVPKREVRKRVIPVKARENYNDDDKNNNDDNNFQKYEKSHAWIFWIGFGIASIFFIIFFVILIKVLMGK